MYDCVIGALMYGSELRVTEALRLRIKDLDFDSKSSGRPASPRE